MFEIFLIIVGVFAVLVVLGVVKNFFSSGSSDSTFAIETSPGSSKTERELITLLQQGKSLISFGDQLPRGINFMKSEQPMIAVNGVEFIRTKSEFVAGRAGVSVPVLKGIRVHAGRSRGRRVETQHVLDTGTLVATSKCFYFIGNRNMAKYPYAKLMLCRPTGRGRTIELTKNTANAKTEYFSARSRASAPRMIGAYLVYEHFVSNPDAVHITYSDDTVGVVFADGDADFD